MAITNKDIEKLKDVFATKEDSDIKFKEVLAGQDKIIKELERAREDRVFAIGKDREQDRQLDDLGQRVNKIEAKIGA